MKRGRKSGGETLFFGSPKNRVSPPHPPFLKEKHIGVWGEVVPGSGPKPAMDGRPGRASARETRQNHAFAEGESCLVQDVTRQPITIAFPPRPPFLKEKHIGVWGEAVPGSGPKPAMDGRPGRASARSPRQNHAFAEGESCLVQDVTRQPITIAFPPRPPFLKEKHIGVWGEAVPGSGPKPAMDGRPGRASARETRQNHAFAEARSSRCRTHREHLAIAEARRIASLLGEQFGGPGETTLLPEARAA